MSLYEHKIASPVRTAGGDWLRTVRARAIASETVQTLSATARDALFANAMKGSALASLAISSPRISNNCFAAPTRAAETMPLTIILPSIPLLA